MLIAEDEFLLVLALEEAFPARGFSIVGPVAEVGEAERLTRKASIDAAVPTSGCVTRSCSRRFARCSTGVFQLGHSIRVREFRADRGAGVDA